MTIHKWLTIYLTSISDPAIAGAAAAVPAVGGLALNLLILLVMLGLLGLLPTGKAVGIGKGIKHSL